MIVVNPKRSAKYSEILFLSMENVLSTKKSYKYLKKNHKHEPKSKIVA